MVRALIWDVDGTLAETERDGHRLAFNRAFEHFALPWRWSEQRYGELLRVAGGLERLLHDMASQPSAPSGEAERAALALQVHRQKNRFYADIVAAGRIELRPGVAELMDDCLADRLPMAIATTTSRANVGALLGAAFGAGWSRRFASVACAEDAPAKKPDPQVYHLSLQRLGIPASAALAIEDSSPGLAACAAAGIPAIVTRSAYFANIETDAALASGPGLQCRGGWTVHAADMSMTFGSATAARVDLALLRSWHAAQAVPASSISVQASSSPAD